MPWQSTNRQPGCDGWAVVQTDTGQTVGCHDTRRQADRHIAALHANVTENAMTVRERLRLRLRESGDRLQLLETSGGQRRIRIIAPGWGTSGYYPADMLERDGPAVFTAGTHMYLDHPSRSETTDRPERSIRDLAATLATDATWQEAGPLGPGLYADIDILPAYSELLDQLAEHIGVSIRASGTAEPGEADGRRGRIVTELVDAQSVDFVTKPGAGGRIVPLLEAAQALQEARNVAEWFESRIHLTFTQRADDMFGEGRLTRDERLALSSAIGDALDAFRTAVETDAPHLYERDLHDDPQHAPAMTESDPPPAPIEENPMTPEEIQEAVASAVAEATAPLTERLDAAEQRADQAEQAATEAREALAARDQTDTARDTARRLLDESDIGLPDAAADRVVETAVANIDDPSDEQALSEAVTAAAQAEQDYLNSIGLTETNPANITGDPPAGDLPDLAGAFGRAFGLSESAAQAAAAGRN